MPVLVSILICTRNRLPALKETLRSMEMLVFPESLEAELVIVDNGSTDGTGHWARQASMPNMPVRVLEEYRQGVGWARTAALRAARGDILLFTDDDVGVPPHWGIALCRPILAGEADVVGGASVLADTLQRPWMTGFHRAALSSSEDMTPEDHPDPITISMAFSRRVLERVPAFDPELGPGSPCGAIEDVLFDRQLKTAGFRFAHVSDAPVVHHPSGDRLSRPAFLRAARARGRSMAYIGYHWDHWTVERFTHRTQGRQTWRHPYVVLLKRWAHLWGWRLLHVRAWRRSEGIARTEFGLVNLLSQIRQYLVERQKARNYDHRGLVKRRGVLPDDPTRAMREQASPSVGA